jgi:hypothetical protein
MADEIVAKYRVDVSGASAALDQLAAKTQKTGQTLDDSFNKGSDGVKRLQSELAKQPKTLADLELRLVKLKELLRDDTKIGTEGFKQVTKAINDTNAAIKQANASLAETPKQTNFVTDGLKKIGAAMLAAFAVDKIISFTKEAITLAAKAEGVERAFAKIGSPELLAGLRNATNGTVTDLVLMQSAVKASNFKIPLDQLGNLLKYAQMQARATGQDVDYLVESLITGIGRKSVLVLDNLQISAVELREKLGDVSMETATVGQVAEAVGTIASASFAKMGAQALTTADEIAQMETAYSNFMLKVGAVANSALIPFAKYIGVISQDAQAVADLQLKLSGASLGQTLKIVNELTAEYEKARKARDEFGMGAQSIASGKARDQLTVARELLDIAKEDYELKQKTRAGGFEEEAPKPSEIDVSIQANINKKLEEEAKLRASQIQNIFFVDKALADLNDELNGEATSLERITAILPLINALEEQRKTILGEETIAAKNKRLADEALLKIEEKRAEEYNKAQEAEAERLLKQEEDNAKERVKIAEDMAKMLIEIERYLARESNDILDLDLADNQRFYESRIEEATKGIAELAKTEEESSAIFQAITDEKNQADLDAQAAHNARVLALNKEKVEALRNQETTGTKLTEDEKQQVIQASGQAIAQLSGMISQRVIEGYQMELTALEERYNQGLISEQQYQRERSSLLAKQFRAQQDAAIIQAVINTALAVTSALTAGPIVGPILAALTAVLGAAEIAVILSQPMPQFAKGVVDLQGEGTGTSDSISAKLSKGESVITAKETSKHKGLLEAMNKGLAEKYILSNYVKPALDSAMLSGFADMGKSAELNGLTANLKDHNIIAAMDRHRAADVAGFKMLAAKLDRRQTKRGGYA